MSEALPARRVLLVEDEFFVAMAMEEILHSFGHEVVGPSGELDEAMGLARGQAIDLALLDVDLRGRPVFPLADILGGRGIPYVLVTGHDASSLPEAYRSRPRLRKPFEARELATAISRALASAGP